MQSPTEGAGFVAQWYAGGERSGQACALSNVGELRFFAFFAEAPMVIPDDATRAMLCARIQRTGQRPLTARAGDDSP